MNIKSHFIVICQNAFLAAGTHNLNLINIFTTINADRFPFTYARFSLVANLDIEPTGQHTLNTVIVDPHGAEKAKTALPVTVSGPNFQVIANFENMRFESPGHYELKVDMDGTPVGSRVLQVNLVVPAKNGTANVA
jgi:hypothetical protein